MLVEQRKQPHAQRLVAPYVLKPLQHRRDVVPRLRVDPDLLDGYLTELELRSVNFSHGVSVAKIVPKWVDPGEIPRKNTTPGRSSPLESRDTPVESTTCGFFLQALTNAGTLIPDDSERSCRRGLEPVALVVRAGRRAFASVWRANPGGVRTAESRSVESGSESTWNGARPRASIHASENPASLAVAASAPNSTPSAQPMWNE